MLVPVGAALPHEGSVVLADDDELPSQAARVAGRLAASLRAPLLVTHVLPATGRPLHDRAGELTGGAHRAADRPLVVRPGGCVAGALAAIATGHEAALVVIAGRGPGHTLLPRRRAARRLLADAHR
jgi:hypothetical protein